MFQGQMTLTTAHAVNELHLSDTSSRRWTIFLKTVCKATGLGSMKKTYETYRQRTMHLFAKTQTSHNCCSRHSLPFCKFSVTTTDPWKVFICSK